MRPILVTVALGMALLAPPAEARTQLERLVKAELRAHGFSDVRVEDLTTAQLSAIYSTANRPGSGGQKRGMIKSILGGKNALRGLFDR